jgi:Cyclin, C-terminal domain/Cyclin, N-terminal domain
LLLASKFDELDDSIPLIREFQRVCAKQRVIPYEDIIKCEMFLLKKMNWDLFKLTPLHFVQNLIGQGIVFSTDRVFVSDDELVQIDEKTLKSVKKYSEFFSDLAMQEYEFLMQFRPSIIAIACIICARQVSKIYPEWNK